MTDDTMRSIMMHFLTKPQPIDYGKNSTATFEEWKLHCIDYINNIEEYEAYWDQINEAISIFYEHIDILNLRCDAKKNIFWIESDHTDSEETEIKSRLGKTAIYLLNATIAWETEQLPKYEIYENKEKISIFLSLTSVTLDDTEKETIIKILKRMAQDKGYVYDKMQNVSFEIELRGEVGESTLLTNQIQTEDIEIEDDISFDWI